MRRAWTGNALWPEPVWKADEIYEHDICISQSIAVQYTQCGKFNGAAKPRFRTAYAPCDSLRDPRWDVSEESQGYPRAFFDWFRWRRSNWCATLRPGCEVWNIVVPLFYCSIVLLFYCSWSSCCCCCCCCSCKLLYPSSYLQLLFFENMPHIMT